MMLEHAVLNTEKHINSKKKTERKEIGQFFTSKETARFMSNMFSIPESSTVSVLDPGAGTGILSIALIERLQHYDHIEEINLTCYENDPEVIDVLRENLSFASCASTKNLQYSIIQENYITSQMDDFNHSIFSAKDTIKFDLVIGNPPYKKISKDASEAIAMPRICYGAPNLYFLFAAMSLYNLRDHGEMVYIMPRSWTSGNYFKAFREYLLSEGKLISMHLFNSRDKVFEQESVLQETIIVKVRKQTDNTNTIEITSSHSNNDFKEISCIHAAYDTIVSEPEKYVYLVTTEDELVTLASLRKFSNTLPSIGIRMKTGLTVDFRCKDLLRNTPGDHIVPLFYSQHIKDGLIVFPANREFEYIVDDQSGLLQSNRNYLFVKRFTSKEEKRRLQCGIFLSRNFPSYSVISTQNMINFIDAVSCDGLSEDMVYGLYAIMNSTIYDTYYRLLNGSTQVNSTEINAMPVPSASQILEMGKKLRSANVLTVKACDQIIMEAIYEQD